MSRCASCHFHLSCLALTWHPQLRRTFAGFSWMLGIFKTSRLWWRSNPSKSLASENHPMPWWWAPKGPHSVSAKSTCLPARNGWPQYIYIDNILYLDPWRSVEANVKSFVCVFDHVKGKIALKTRVKTWEQYSKILETIPQILHNTRVLSYRCMGGWAEEFLQCELMCKMFSPSFPVPV